MCDVSNNLQTNGKPQFGEAGFGGTGFGEAGFGGTGFGEAGFGETGFDEAGGHPRHFAPRNKFLTVFIRMPSEQKNAMFLSQY